jgi:hypothetical protein
MLEDLKEVILNLEKSLNMMVQDEEVELLKHPEYLEAMKEVVQSINQVTRTLKNLEESYSEGRERDKQKQAEMTQTLKKLGEPYSEASERDKEKQVEMEKASGPADRILSIVKKKPKDRRAFSE